MRNDKTSLEKSATGIYHVILKGIDGRNLFMDDSARLIFMEKLYKAKKIEGFKLYAYCLINSEAVEDDRYLSMVSWYIHQNPLKVRMISRLGDY